MNCKIVISTPSDRDAGKHSVMELVYESVMVSLLI